MPSASAVPSPDDPYSPTTDFAAFMAPVGPARGKLVGFLVAFHHDPLGVFFPLYAGPNTVGRSGAASDLAIAIPDPTTSTRHATIHCDPGTGRVVVEDIGSTNGTWVNEVKLPCPGRCELKDGDYVRFGGYVLRLLLVRRD